MLKKQEVILTDETGSIRVVLWESDIEIFDSGSSYELNKAVLKTYENKKYLTLNRQTVIKPTEVKITRDDDKQVLQAANLKKICCPADCVEKITSYLSYNKCNASLNENIGHKVIQCPSCGCGQLKAKSLMAKVLFIKDKKRVSLTIIKVLFYSLYYFYLLCTILSKTVELRPHQ